MPKDYNQGTKDSKRVEELKERLNRLRRDWRDTIERNKQDEVANFNYQAKVGSIYSQYGKSDVKQARKDLLPAWQKDHGDTPEADIPKLLPKKRDAFRALGRAKGVHFVSPELKYNWSKGPADERPMLFKDKDKKNIESQKINYKAETRPEYLKSGPGGYVERPEGYVYKKGSTEEQEALIGGDKKDSRGSKQFRDLYGTDLNPVKNKTGYQMQGYRSKHALQENQGKETRIQGKIRAQHTSAMPGFAPSQPLPAVGPTWGDKIKRRELAKTRDEIEGQLHPLTPKLKPTAKDNDEQGRKQYRQLMQGKGADGKTYGKNLHRAVLGSGKDLPDVIKNDPKAQIDPKTGTILYGRRFNEDPLGYVKGNAGFDASTNTPFTRPDDKYLPGELKKRQPATDKQTNPFGYPNISSKEKKKKNIPLAPGEVDSGHAAAAERLKKINETPTKYVDYRTRQAGDGQGHSRDTNDLPSPLAPLYGTPPPLNVPKVKNRYGPITMPGQQPPNQSPVIKPRAVPNKFEERGDLFAQTPANEKPAAPKAPKLGYTNTAATTFYQDPKRRPAKDFVVNAKRDKDAKESKDLLDKKAAREKNYDLNFPTNEAKLDFTDRSQESKAVIDARLKRQSDLQKTSLFKPVDSSAGMGDLNTGISNVNKNRTDANKLLKTAARPKFTPALADAKTKAEADRDADLKWQADQAAKQVARGPDAPLTQAMKDREIIRRQQSKGLPAIKESDATDPFAIRKYQEDLEQKNKDKKRIEFTPSDSKDTQFSSKLSPESNTPAYTGMKPSTFGEGKGAMKPGKIKIPKQPIAPNPFGPKPKGDLTLPSSSSSDSDPFGVADFKDLSSPPSIPKTGKKPSFDLFGDDPESAPPAPPIKKPKQAPPPQEAPMPEDDGYEQGQNYPLVPAYKEPTRRRRDKYSDDYEYADDPRDNPPPRRRQYRREDDFDGYDEDEAPAPRGGRGGGQGNYVNRYGGHNPVMNQFQGGSYYPQGDDGWGQNPQQQGGYFARKAGEKVGGFLGNVAGGLTNIANPLNQAAGAVSTIWDVGKDILGINEAREEDREARAEETYQKRLAEAESLRRATKEESEDERKRRIKQEKYDDAQRIKKVIADQYRATQASQYGQTNAYGSVDWEGNVADGTRRLVSKLDKYQQQKKDTASRMAGELSAKDAYGKTAEDVQSKVLSQWHRDNDQRLADEKKATQERLLARGFVEGSAAWNKAMKQVADSHEKEIANVNDHATELGHKYGDMAFNQKMKVFEQMDSFKDPLGLYEKTSAIGTHNIKDAVMQSGELEHKRAMGDADIRNKDNLYGLEVQKARQQADAQQAALRNQHTLQDEQEEWQSRENRAQRGHETEIEGAKHYHEAGLQSARLEHETEQQYRERMLKRELLGEEQDFKRGESKKERRLKQIMQGDQNEFLGEEGAAERGSKERIAQYDIGAKQGMHRNEIRSKEKLSADEIKSRKEMLEKEIGSKEKLSGDEIRSKEGMFNKDIASKEGMFNKELASKESEGAQNRNIQRELQEDQHVFQSGENSQERKIKQEIANQEIALRAHEGYQNREQEGKLQVQRLNHETDEHYLDRLRDINIALSNQEFQGKESAKQRTHESVENRRKLEGESQQQYDQRMGELDRLEMQQRFTGSESFAQREHEIAQNTNRYAHESQQEYQKRIHDLALESMKETHLSSESQLQRQHEVDSQTERFANETQAEYDKRLYDAKEQEQKQKYESQENAQKREADYKLEQERLQHTAEENKLNRLQEQDVQKQQQTFTKGENEAQRKFQMAFDREKRQDESDENYKKRMNALDILEETNQFNAGENDRKLEFEMANARSQRSSDANEGKERRAADIALQQQRLDADLAAQNEKQVHESNEAAKEREFKRLADEQKLAYEKEMLSHKGDIDEKGMEKKFENEKYLKLLDIKARKESEDLLYREEDRRTKNKLEWERSEAAREFARKDEQAARVLEVEDKYKTKQKKLDHQHEVLINKINNDYAADRNSQAHKDAIDEANNAYTQKRAGLDYKLDQARTVFDMVHSIFNTVDNHNRMNLQEKRQMLDDNRERWKMVHDPSNLVNDSFWAHVKRFMFGGEAKYKETMDSLASHNM
jgi:hypothetical protein